MFGPSGVGKSTLARLLAGKETGYSGTLRVEAVSSVLYSYNTERLPGWTSVGDHLDAVTATEQKPLLDELKTVFGLTELMTSRFTQLSMGQQNRVNLVRYLVQEFDALIMDESLANVDEVTREKIILSIKRLFSDKLFFYISHNVAEVARFCQDILVLRGSRRTPQAISITGQNQTGDDPPQQSGLEQTMLEIVHAS